MSPSVSEPVKVRIAHSPDSDDAFMFYALTQGILDTEGLEIEHVLSDIESLNQAAFEGTYEITALSFHGYAHLADRYAIMPSGASFGDNYGPVVVARQDTADEALEGARFAIPGRLTTAYLALQLWRPGVDVVETPFDQILDVVESGEVAAGVVIVVGGGFVGVAVARWLPRPVFGWVAVLASLLLQVNLGATDTRWRWLHFSIDGTDGLTYPAIAPAHHEGSYVVGLEEPLVRVDRDRVGSLEPRHPMGVSS